MGLHLASLLAIAGCLVAGGLLLCRYLPRPGTATVMACVRCGMPAAAIAEPFTCPGCGHDVRETGLAPARGRSPVRPLLAALAYTAVVLVVAMISSAVLVQKVPREQRSFMETSLAGPLSQAYAGVELALSGSEPEGQPSNGTWEVVADLSGRDGRMTSLEARGPYPKWVIITSDGQRLNVGDAAYDRAVLRWMTEGGVNTDDPKVASEAREVAGEIRHLIEPAIYFQTGTGFMSSMSGSNGATRPPPWVAPAAALAWAPVWVLGLWAILRRSTRPPTTEPQALTTGAPARTPAQVDGGTPT